jgi:tryptophan 7-halogenase
MSVNPIKKIVIVGGGTAGWMSAALLSKVFDSKVSITLVESDTIATVGVGEATVPMLHQFNALLGIDELEFVRTTQATFKLGISFENWGCKGQKYFHPFGKYGDNFDIAPFYQYWLRTHLAGQSVSLDEYSLCAIAAKQGRFLPPPSQEKGTVWSTYSYAFHFDAGRYANFLRQYAEQRAVERIEGIVTQVALREADGFVASLLLDDGRCIEGDLFLDCSGFRGLLIEGALHTGYEDWSHWLPCDRAVAVPCVSSKGDFIPYTRAIAHSAGWQWRIPLQHRTGNGHVYASHYLTDDEAMNTLVTNLGGAILSEPRVLQFTTGRRKKIWNKNVVAIGLASGFLEPLESTSIHLIQTGLSKLINWFPDLHFEPRIIDQYNYLHGMEVERIRDFIILHYAATQRDDSEFWRYCRNMPLPASLNEKMDMFARCGRLIDLQGDFFKETSWLAVLLGQGITPKCYDPMAALYDEENLHKVFATMRDIIQTTAAKMPTQREFIDRFCRASDK